MVWSLRSVQLERYILPQLVQCGSLQRHQVVLLEGAQSDGNQDSHDGAPSEFLMADTMNGGHSPAYFELDC